MCVCCGTCTWNTVMASWLSEVNDRRRDCALQFVMVFSWIDYQRVDKLPKWADALGWLMTLSVILAIIVTAIVRICMARGSFSEVKYCFG